VANATAMDRVDWLRHAVSEGRIHTVRLSFGDHLGVWRGKRIPASHFLEHHLDAPMGFCDGMLVCDVGCDIIQETPFSNFETGYPDVHVWPELDRLREAVWAPGEAYVFGAPADHDGSPVGTGPSHVLNKVVSRLVDRGLEPMVRGRLGGRFMQTGRSGATWAVGGLSPGESAGALDIVMRGLLEAGISVRGASAGPSGGEFEVEFGSGTPRDIAESVLIAKGACKEIGAASGTRATFMTRTLGGSRPSVMTFDVEFDGADQVADTPSVSAFLQQARGLFQPSVTAFKAGPPPEPRVESVDGGTILRGIVASAEADPFVAIAVSLAAIAEALSKGSTAVSANPRSLADAAEALRANAWIREWLGSEYVSNTIPLLEHEGALFDEVVSDWEIERYWSAS
jgi:glutamine synthetase